MYVIVNPLHPNLNFVRVRRVPNLNSKWHCSELQTYVDSSNSLRFILVNEVTIQGNINSAVINKDTGMLLHYLKLSQARLDEEDRKIVM